MADKNADDNSLDLVWGATDIACALDLPGPSGRRKVFRLLETGAIPARKIGGSWVASRTKLRRHVVGDDPDLATAIS